MKQLRQLHEPYSIIKYNANEIIPQWVFESDLYSITKTDKELSIVCSFGVIPHQLQVGLSRWQVLYLEGPIAFEETGVILSIIEPISSKGLEVFVVSTYNGDLFLFKEEQFNAVVNILSNKSVSMRDGIIVHTT